MSDETALKRNSDVLNEEPLSDVNGPQPKQPKTEMPEPELNLENAPTQQTIDETNASKEPSFEAECCISIKFHNEVFSELYKSKFLDFITSFPELQVQNDSDFVIQIYRDENEENIEKRRKNKHSKVKKELFMVDANPSDTTFQTDLRYTTKFTISTEKSVNNNGDVISAPRVGCFNCGEHHSLRDCQIPKDYSRIATARQRFKVQNKSLRYHIEEGKFGHLQPGKLSNELRKALGLQKNEAPHFIYLMRKLGYPPGWLEEAKFVHSNLDMFDIEGKNVKNAAKKKNGLDESKVVDYPGFNVPFQKGVRDDYRVYRVPPYSEEFNKQAMISYFEKMCVPTAVDLETHDSDYIQAPTLTEGLQMKSDVDRTSPSLVDLEQQKRQLLEELNDEPKDKNDFDSEKGFLAIKTSCFGTPLLKSNSPYSSLPNPDNFSKDVSPVINFENLPNSTGKYEQLTDVLQKVRDTLKKPNSSS